MGHSRSEIHMPIVVDICRDLFVGAVPDED